MRKKAAKSQASRKGRSRKFATVAPGQALGYGLQNTRLTVLLLDAPEEAFCSLEFLDDVAEQTSKGEVRLSQVKSTLGGNPVADRAVGLWKTLHNWVEAVRVGHVNPERTTFEIYVSRPVSGKIIQAFSSATTTESAKQAIAFAKDILWGTKPKYPLRSKLPELPLEFRLPSKKGLG